MIEKRHAIRTEDESVWIDFDGEVPRVGDSVSLGCIGEEYELSKETAGRNWIVYKVLWFLCSWRKEPHPSPNLETLIISQARVFIKEVKKVGTK